MTLSMEVSPELAKYGQQLEEWAVAVGRLYAREADTRHARPDNWSEILDTCPVPLGRAGKGEADALPRVPDGEWIRALVFHESLNYGDPWMYGSVGNGIGHLVVEAMGTPEQIERWYDPVVRDGTCTGFALTEPQFGSDTSLVATTARRDGDMWVLSGVKLYCSQGAIADYTTVFATTDRDQGPAAIKAFVVPRETRGYVVVKENEEKLGMRSWMTSQLAFDECAIPLENMLGCGPDGEGSPRQSGRGGALAALNNNRPNMAAIAVGLARASLDVAGQELKSRSLGFTPQRWAAVQRELALMRTAIDRGRRMAYRSQDAVQRGRPDRAISAMGKAYAPETAERVIRRCMQLLGPDGTSQDLLIEKWWRDCKILDIFEGTGQIQRLLIARGLMGRAAG
ncbi:acyl-CoA dehydrogenase family protein [Dactylosporangium sp. NPDC048998]|uniref:acyl-CoA dehydrogenase family protein n=1 Tax=Dactylosporangium sp. NPDC048998 TaxID=3363976 RepID=UPI003713B62A